MKVPDLTTRLGFAQYRSTLLTMILTNREFPGAGDAHTRVVESAQTLKMTGFNPDELRAMLAITIDMMAFPEQWGGDGRT